MLVFSLFSSLLPVGLLALTIILVSPSGAIYEARLSAQVADEVTARFAETAAAHAKAADNRLDCLGYSVKLLRSYAEEVLSAPAVFAAQVAPGLTGAGSADPEDNADADTAATETDASKLTEPAPLDNPLFYAKSEDGAIRKLIDDGRPAVYFAARADGQFSEYDMQRLYASTMLDALLIEPVISEPLCSQAFMITRDGLLRTYPFRDFSLWPADKDLSKPGSYWNQSKANADGLIWTTPYVSALTQHWVVACISAAMAADRVIAVVGIEIDVSNLLPQLLEHDGQTAGLHWLIKPTFAEGDQPQQWIVLSAGAGGKELLGVVPLDIAALPDETRFGPDILKEADFLANGNDLILVSVERNLDEHAASFAGLASEATVVRGTENRFVATAPINETEWILCAETASSALTGIEQQEVANQSWLGQRLLVAIGVLLLAVILAFLFAWLEARQVVHPLAVLSEQVRQAAASNRPAPVLLSDEGEIGELADAVQVLIDISTRGSGDSPDPSQGDTAEPS